MYNVLVYCRVGSLEMLFFYIYICFAVHCRVGSLETYSCNWFSEYCVHCRVGRFKFFIRYIILTKEIEGHVKYAFLTRLFMF